MEVSHCLYYLISEQNVTICSTSSRPHQNFSSWSRHTIVIHSCGSSTIYPWRCVSCSDLKATQGPGCWWTWIEHICRQEMQATAKLLYKTHERYSLTFSGPSRTCLEGQVPLSVTVSSRTSVCYSNKEEILRRRSSHIHTGGNGTGSLRWYARSSKDACICACTIYNINIVPTNGSPILDRIWAQHVSLQLYW